MGLVELHESESERVITTAPVRLRLRREGDRWTHVFEVRRGGAWSPCAASVESIEGRDELAVVSPTYQEVQVAPGAREDQLALMLVGAFGRHYFAATVTVAANPRGLLDHTQFVFDVVDRCRLRIRSLAATYALSVPRPRTANAEQLSWCVPGSPETAVLLKAAPSPMGPCRLAAGEPEGSPLIARVEAALPLGPLQPGPWSHRFVYSWAFASQRV
jgi:hypothetical protein